MNRGVTAVLSRPNFELAGRTKGAQPGELSLAAQPGREKPQGARQRQRERERKKLDREDVVLLRTRRTERASQRERGKPRYNHSRMSGLGIKLGSLFIRQISKPISVSVGTTVCVLSDLTNTM